MEGSAGVSQRRRHAQPPQNDHQGQVDNDVTDLRAGNGVGGRLHHSRRASLGVVHWTLISLYLVSLLYLCMRLHSAVPSPLSDAQAGKHKFSEQRANTFLSKLTGLGPKPSGSDACEVHAKKLILEELSAINASMSGPHTLTLDVQRASGCFRLDKFDHFSLCYERVLNIAVRLSPKHRKSSGHAALANCHFDTWPGSPGASDDGVSCAVLLDMLRVMTHSPEPFQHDVVFLFNGAEENILMAAHGFITQHPWRHDIRAFINLEACGAGGRELLFQADASNPWLLNLYLEKAPRPHVSVVGQEVFDAGFVPGDTDFRIFRDYGRIAGLDLAFIRNGYVYHTEFDTMQFVTPGSVQRAGENIMATVTALANSDVIANQAKYTGGRNVFFDVLGVLTVVYPLWVGRLLNYAACAAVVANVLHSVVAHAKQTDFGQGAATGAGVYGAGKLLAMLLLQLFACLCSLLTTLMCSRLVHLLSASMCWYSDHRWLVPLYVAPGVAAGFAVHWLVASRASAASTRAGARSHVAAAHDAMVIIQATILFALTSFGLASAFFWLILAAFPLAKSIICKLGGIHGPAVWLHVLCASFPLIMIIHSTSMLVDMFIPIMGRSLAADSDLTMAVLSWLAGVGILLQLGALVHGTCTASMLRYLRALGVLVVLCYMAAALFSHPYKWDPQAPRLRRLQMLHVHQVLMGRDDGVLVNRSAVLLAALDHRRTEDLPREELAPALDMRRAFEPDCSLTNSKFCDLPYYLPVTRILPPREFRWVPTAAPPDVVSPLQLQLVRRKLLPDGAVNLTLHVEGADHLGVQITAQSGWRLVGWSFPGPPFYPTKTSFVYLAYGMPHVNPDTAAPMSNWTFSLLMRPSDTPPSKPSTDGKSVLVGVASHQLHGERSQSPVLEPIVDTIRRRRLDPEQWRWAITPGAWNAQFYSAYF